MTTLTMPTRPSGFLADLRNPRDAFANLTPNWFASVMGTGIVAVAAASLPVRFDGLHTFGLVMWAGAVLLLVALTAATAVHWLRHPETARSHLGDPVMAHFYGAPAMALLTVGAGTLLLGKDVLGLPAALAVDWLLWGAGTVLGLGTAAVVPYLMFRRRRLSADRAFGGWLMPVVPPMVSASTGALLVPHTADGPLRLTLLLACYALFGISLAASVPVITLIVRRLARRDVGQARMVPTLWIVLGPLGQSITAVNLLGAVAHEALPAPATADLHDFGVGYGLFAWTIALIWAVIATAVTVRTAQAGLPFSLTWWSFTFPIGTCVTGTSALALHTGFGFFRYAAVVIYAALVTAWLIVAARTAHGSYRGRLFLDASPR